MDDRILYCFPFFLSATLIFIAGLFTFRRVEARGGWYLAWMCMASTLWALSEGMLYLGHHIETNILITKLQYLGIASVPPLALLFGLSVFGFESRVNCKTCLPLLLIASAIVLLVWTNPLHKLFFSAYYTIQSGTFPMLGLEHGPLWWAVLLYHYFLMAVLSIILLHQMFTSSGYQRYQAGVVLVAVAFVWLSNAVYVSGNSPVPNMDIGPIAFVAVAGAMAWGFFRYGLLDILPVAKAEIFRGLDDIIIVTDAKDRILDINPVAESGFKIKASQIKGQSISDALRKYPQLQQVFGDKASSEICLIQDGQEHVYDLRVSALTDKNELEIGKVIALRDVTDRKQAEENLRKEEAKFRLLVETSPQGLALIGKDGAYKYINPRFTEIFGYTLADVPTAKVWFEKAFPNLQYRQQVISSWGGDMTRTGPGETRPRIYKVTCQDGSKKEINIQSISQETGDQFILFEDISEKSRLEAQLRQVQKMEAIGTFAGGIAHDFNNILGTMVGYIELLLGKTPPDSSEHEELQEVLGAGLRARDLVKQILTFSRQAEQKMQPVQVNLIVKEALKFLRSSLPSSIEIRRNIASDGCVLADPTQIHQVLMNLCTNAKDAMQQTDGVLEVSLVEEQLDAGFAAAHSEAAAGPHLKLTVADSGEGMPVEVLEKIFDPFFTTKSKDKGTGLGLAVVHGIVKSCGGFITVDSRPGRGSTFNVFIPVIQNEATIQDENKDPLPVGSERVLFVDDEKLLVDIARQMLERNGYRVTPRTSSVEALELFKARPDDFDLVVTDMTMPNMSGLELSLEIIRLRPDTPVILCTGFSETLNEAGARAAGIKAFLFKPVSQDALIRTARRVLDEKH